MSRAVDSTDIALSVKNGVVSLTGYACNYSQKLQAEADAKRISGVMAVANDIEVRLASIDARPDPDIARDLVAQLEFELPFSHEKIKSVVKSGWVTLDGSLEWNYQRTKRLSARHGWHRVSQDWKTISSSTTEGLLPVVETRVFCRRRT